jgi:hypothetical protein
VVLPAAIRDARRRDRPNSSGNQEGQETELTTTVTSGVPQAVQYLPLPIIAAAFGTAHFSQNQWLNAQFV